jgi:hypothetical protein
MAFTLQWYYSTYVRKLFLITTGVWSLYDETLTPQTLYYGASCNQHRRSNDTFFVGRSPAIPTKSGNYSRSGVAIMWEMDKCMTLR